MEQKTNRELYAWIGFAFTVLVGTLLHFAFKASGGNALVGAFTPVNESVWEHLKLLILPTVLFAIIEYFAFGRNLPAFLSGKIYALFIGMLFVVCGYYTYFGILGRRYIVVDIALFVFSSALTAYLSYRFSPTMGRLASDRQSILALMLLTVIILLFMYFTFHPPMLELFRDPISEDFGIADAMGYLH